MKKLKLHRKLEVNLTTVRSLTSQQMDDAHGGGAIKTYECSTDSAGKCAPGGHAPVQVCISDGVG